MKSWNLREPLSLTLCVVSLSGAYCFAKEAKVMDNKKALIVVTSHKQLGTTGKETGYFLSEVSHPYSVLRAKGFDIDIASPNGGNPPVDPKSHDLSDPANKALLENKESSAKLQNTIKLSNVNPENYGVVFFAGGHGAMFDLPDNKDVARVAARIYENGGVVAAVCHGPAALVNVKLSNGRYLVEGKRVNSFTNEEEASMKLEREMPFLLESKLVERGAKFEKAPAFQSKVVSDQRLITGQNPASAEGVGRAIVEASLAVRPAK